MFPYLLVTKIYCSTKSKQNLLNVLQKIPYTLFSPPSPTPPLAAARLHLAAKPETAPSAAQSAAREQSIRAIYNPRIYYTPRALQSPSVNRRGEKERRDGCSVEPRCRVNHLIVRGGHCRRLMKNKHRRPRGSRFNIPGGGAFLREMIGGGTTRGK